MSVPRAPVVLPDLHDAAVRVLDEAIVDAFHGSALVPIEKVVTAGTPTGVLVLEAVEAALLVVGSRGHGGFTGLLLGSVSMACASHAPCPVLVMHHGDPVPSADRSAAPARVVVGVGDGPAATPVLELAAQAALEMEAELVAVTAWSDAGFSDGSFIDLRSDVIENTRIHLDGRIAEAFPAGRPARLRVALREGSAAAALVAESRTADLVVVGRSGRGMLAGVLLGSVCLAVAEHASSPVLIIPAGTVDEDRMWAPAHLLTAAS